MKKRPRWVTALVALTVILSTTLAPLEGAAAPGPLEIYEDPRYVLGEPDGPGSSLQVVRVTLFDIIVRVVTGTRPELRPLVPQQRLGGTTE